VPLFRLDELPLHPRHPKAGKCGSSDLSNLFDVVHTSTDNTVPAESILPRKQMKHIDMTRFARCSSKGCSVNGAAQSLRSAN